MSDINQQRILVLDLRPRSFGFVAFEGPGEILDWGARSFRRGVNKVRVPFGQKVARLIDRYVPDVLVLARPRRKTERMVREMRKQAKIRKVSVRLLSSGVIDHAFAGHNDNKHQVATAVTGRFPELSFILPSPRRPWQSEDYQMSTFDAGAVGIAYFAHKEARDPIVFTS